MFSFEYNITTNDHGRPVIEPSEKTSKELDSIEHKFMALELSRTIIETTLDTNKKRPVLSEYEEDRLKATLFDLKRISDIFALTIKEQNTLLNSLLEEYDVEVQSIENLHKLKYNGFFFKNRIYSRKEGLRVKVLDGNKIYQLQGGIDNKHWVDVTKNKE